MKHHKSIRKFGRTKSQRTALLRSLAVSLVEHGRITTTEAKAKELRPFIEKLITTGRGETVSAMRIVSARLGGNKDTVKKLVNDLSKKYKDRDGGYTRIIKLSPRGGDGSKMAVIEFV